MADRSILGDPVTKTKAFGGVKHGKQPAYSLALYTHKGAAFTHVLWVEVPVRFVFIDTDSAQWTEDDAEGFKAKFVNDVETLWSNKFTLKDQNFPMQQKVRVEFDIKATDDIQRKFWTLKVKAIPKGETITSEVVWDDYEPYGRKAGETLLDSQDFTAKEMALPENPQKIYRQRAAFHEFGHMLCLRDEYEPPADAVVRYTNPHHRQDYESIMNMGETIRSRHYYPLAHRLTALVNDCGEGDVEWAVPQHARFYVEGRNFDASVYNASEAKLGDLL